MNFRNILKKSWPDIFRWNSSKLKYHRTGHNTLAERVVEIPIVFNWLRQRSNLGNFLEIGNVLIHYLEEYQTDNSSIIERTVVDKFEKQEGVINCDIFDIPTIEKYDTIVSVSTVEHIGQSIDWQGAYGEACQRDRYAPLKAIAHIYDLLKPNGQAFLTVPWGKITDFVWLIQFGPQYLNLLHDYFGIPKKAVDYKAVKKISMLPEGDRCIQEWKQWNPNKLSDVEFNSPWQYANAIACITLTKTKERDHSIETEENLSTDILFSPPIIIGGLFQNDFSFNAKILSSKKIAADQGVVFYGPYKKLKAGIYTLTFAWKSTLNLTLDACTNGGNDILFVHALSGDRVEFEFTLEKDLDIEIRLHNKSMIPGIINVIEFQVRQNL